MTVLAPAPIAEGEYYDPEASAHVHGIVPPPFDGLPPDMPARQPPPYPEPSPVPPGPKPKEPKAEGAATEFLARKLQTISVAIDILSFRLILLVCVIASAVMFGLSILWPDPWRLASACAFSLIVTAPVVFFYRKAN